MESPEPGAAELARRRGIGLGEGLEQARLVASACHADAGIVHGEAQCHLRLPRARPALAEMVISPFLGELDGIVGEIDQDLV